MFWIVQKDHPKPENYIPVFIKSAPPDDRFSNLEKFRVFKSEKAAYQYANEIRSAFGIRNIRLFHENGYSQIWKPSSHN